MADAAGWPTMSLAEMQISISLSDIVTWAPIAISVLALYYSRKAFRYQVVQKRREHVAIVNLRYLVASDSETRWRTSDSSPGVVISNPAEAPLNMADLRYYDRRFGRFQDNIVLRGIRQHTQRYAGIGNMLAERREAERRVVEILIDRHRARQDLPLTERVFDKFLYLVFDSYYSFRNRLSQFKMRNIFRPTRMRGKRGRLVVAEMFLMDEAGEEWYVNIERERLRVPRSVLPRFLFMTAYRLRLIGYPFWLDWGWSRWVGYSLWFMNLVLISDHYVNGGRLLADGLSMMSATPS